MFLQVSRRWFRENKEDHFDIYAAAVWGAADVNHSGKLLTPCCWVLASCTSYEDARLSAMYWRCELSLSSRLTCRYVFISQMKCERGSMQIILASMSNGLRSLWRCPYSSMLIFLDRKSILYSSVCWSV